MSSFRTFNQLAGAPTELLALISIPPFLYAPRISHQTTHHVLPASRKVSTSSLPRISQPSLWKSMIPKPFRKRAPPDQQSSASRITWRENPMTPFLLLGILAGSQAIHTLKLKNETLAYNRKADAKISLLREVIERVQNGENVDVERILGTGDPQSEKEWAECELLRC